MHSFWILIENSHQTLTVLQKKSIINSIIKTKNYIKTMKKHSKIDRPTKLTKPNTLKDWLEKVIIVS